VHLYFTGVESIVGNLYQGAGLLMKRRLSSARDLNGLTPVHVACLSGNIEVCSAFLSMGWLRVVGSLKLHVSSAEYRLFSGVSVYRGSVDYIHWALLRVRKSTFEYVDSIHWARLRVRKSTFEYKGALLDVFDTFFEFIQDIPGVLHDS